MSHLRRMFAVVALALLVAPLAASAPLFDPDEGLHAAIAQEMAGRGDYVTPTFRGEPFLDKPIPFLWAEAASLRLVGHNEAAVRLPPLLFGLFGMVTVALLGRALFGEPAGLAAGIVYGTMLLPMGVSEVAVHDIGLVPFLCLAALSIARIAGADDVPPSSSVPSAFGRTIVIHAAIAGVALGLSILTKGLVGIVFTGIFAACLVARRPATLVRVTVLLTIAIIIAVAVAAPWYLAMEHAHPGYLHYYFVERHLQGYLTATQRHGGRPFWYYVPIVLGGALPWTAYLVPAWREARGNALRLALWAWFGIGLVFLSIGESKLLTYALPLFPALALIVGEYLATLGGVRVRMQGLVFKLAFGAQVLALALLPALGLLVIEWKFGTVSPYLWLSVVTLGVLAIDAGRRAARSTSDYGFMAGIVGMTLYTLVAMMIVAPRAAVWMTGRDLAATLNTDGTLPPHVSLVDERIGSLIFYLDPGLRREATPDRIESTSFSEAMTRSRTEPPDAVTVVRNSQLPRFTRLFPSPPAADARAGTFSLFRADTLRTALRVP
jgi:4-amino-4-deoxy-L-arabinose transferase-like glycosyltransferase